MRILTITLIAFFTVHTLQAQTHTGHDINKKTAAQVTHPQLLRYLLHKQTPVAEKTTQVQERLIGISDSLYGIPDYNGNQIAGLSLYDSTRFMYSSYRSSIFDFNFMIYFSDYYLNADTYVGSLGNLAFYDHNNASLVQYDTATVFMVNPLTFTYGFWAAYSITYANEHDVINYTDNIFNNTSDKYINTYDGNNNITTSLYFYGAQQPDTSELRYFIYDGMDRIILDSTDVYNYNSHSWAQQYKNNYTYDNAGNLIQIIGYLYNNGAWQSSGLSVMTYYNDNRLQTIHDYATDTVLVNDEADSLGYTNGINYATYTKAVKYSNGTINDISVNTKHIALSGLPDTQFTAVFSPNGVLSATHYTTYVYDAFNLPVVANSGSYDTSQVFDSASVEHTHYYYETYGHPASVSNTVSPAANIKVYPNPASQAIYIAQTGVAIGAYRYISLLNAAGQK